MLDDMEEGLEPPVATNLQYTAGEYRRRMEEAARTGECVFCSDAFRNDPDHPILDTVVVGRARWYARERDPFPITDREGQYPRLWLILFRDQHGLGQTEEDAIALHRMEQWLAKFYNVPRRYAICQRMGPGAGMIVVHLHRHFIVPDTKIDDDGKKVPNPYYFGVG